MPNWNSLIEFEQILLDQISLDESGSQIRLFDPEHGFIPNPGGQSDFFSRFPLQLDPPENQDLTRFICLLGGIGSGKTFSGAIWAILQSLWYPHLRGLITANSFPQLLGGTCVGLVEACRKYNIPLRPQLDGVEDSAIKIANARRCYIGRHETFWRVLSVGAFCGGSQTGRGAEYQRIWIDEGAYAPEQAFQVIDGRLRSSHGDRCQAVITTSPNGFNWLYNRFADPTRSEVFQRLFQMIVCTTAENEVHLGGADYVESLRANYTYEMALQELEAVFVSDTVGKVYKYFLRSQNTMAGLEAECLDYDPTLPLLISFDFNATPCVAVLAQKRMGEVHVFREFFVLDADIWELCNAIADWANIVQPQTRDLYIYGDATGRARSATSKLSAWDIVWDTLGKSFELHRKFANANPRVRERTNSVNLSFKNQKCYLSLDNCPELIKDLEQITYDRDLGIDKSDPLRSHLSDALGYLLHKEYGLIRPIQKFDRIAQVRIPGAL